MASRAFSSVPPCCTYWGRVKLPLNPELRKQSITLLNCKYTVHHNNIWIRYVNGLKHNKTIAIRMPQQKDIVKIAIQMPGAYPQLIQLDQKKPLSAVIKEVCDRWNLQGPDNYALQYADGVQTYITESNRLDIKNGSILRLTKAPSRCAEDLFKGIQSSDSGVRCDSLKQLASLSTDVTFAQEFINRDGHSLLVKIVEDHNESAVIMTHTLMGFMELMDHGIVSWENLSLIFIKKIASFVNAKALDASIQQVSLAILESMVQSSSSLFHHIMQEVTLERLILHLQVTNQQIQTKAMALLMALLQTAGEEKRRELFDFLAKKNLRQYIYKNIIHSSGPVGDEMAHYLYVLQSLSLNQLEPRMRTPLDSYSQDQREILHALRQAAFETESENSLSTERRRSLCAKEFKKLGFSNNSNPGQDLNRTPPGLLALDTMGYFASRNPDAFSRFVLENSSREDKHECPFARSSIQLTLILCEILRIGEPPSETGSHYHPVFFSQDRLLDELFCICIQLLNKTWKEMRATQEDFDKVMQVVREQITRTLSSKPTSLELFKNKVNALNYSEILKLRQTERLHQEETLAPPVLELKERLKPELLELIRQQRLHRLCHGTLFRKISSRRRQDKLWYCRLSPNHKMLHYGDVEEEAEMPSIEALQEKIPVADIKGLLTGKDCPHMKENKGKQTKEVLDLAFSITYDVEEYSLNFIASSRTDFCLWTDGLNVLLGRDMSSECMRSELEILLSMEIKLRLLDLENVPIPERAPAVPNPPSNFNFCYDFSQAEQ
ncbi:engulfment and cell motility protein 3 isoform X1 [Alosa alosa]|nr:engulfment and cell motility protein 3 isoform X1 [Alosa alosa]